MKLIVEDKQWEDFTMVYQDHIEVFEVKWYHRNVSLGVVHNIFKNERLKNLRENDKVTIVTRVLSPKLREDYDYATKYGFWWINYPEFKKYLKKDPVHRRLTRNGWTSNQISLFKSASIVEFESKLRLASKIEEFFVIDYPVYLDRQDQQSVIALTFRKIMDAGTNGGQITKDGFGKALNDFVDHVVDVPTRIRPSLTVGKRIIRLTYFLKSKKRLQELNHKTYLSQITANTRLLYYLYHKLLESRFDPRSFDFFFQGVLIKRNYAFLAMNVLETRWQQHNVDPEYIVTTIVRNFEKFQDPMAINHALKLLEEIVKAGLSTKYRQQILSLLKKQFLSPLSGRKILTRNWSEKRYQIQHAARILIAIHQKTSVKQDFIDFVFKYFDMTGDDFPLVMETPSDIYGVVLSFLRQDPSANLEYVVTKIGEQFNIRYNGKYRGFEHGGASHSQSGGKFEISDIGVVRLLFRPFFETLYKAQPLEAWNLIEKRILLQSPKGSSVATPMYLKRSVIPLLVSRIGIGDTGAVARTRSFTFLKNILSIQKGFPDTSSVIFASLCETELAAFGYQNIMQLVEVDCNNTTEEQNDGYPSNVFVIITLLRIVKAGYEPAMKFMLALMGNLRYQHYWGEKTINLLSYESVQEAQPNFVSDLIEELDIEMYLCTKAATSRHSFLRSDFIREIILKDWSDGTNRFNRIRSRLLRKDQPCAEVLNFITGPIQDLSKRDPEKAFQAYNEFLQTKDIFRRKFHNSSFAREHFVWLAKELAKKGSFNEARRLIDFCIDDPDPNTNDRNSPTNLHYSTIEGEIINAITSVRGSVCCALTEFAQAKEPDQVAYALEMTERLLDLDHSLHSQLGYTSPDYYVRLQALRPLTVLLHPAQRIKLDEHRLGLDKRPIEIALLLVKNIKEDVGENGLRPSAVVDSLIEVFDQIRDLSTDEASELLDLFEALDVQRSVRLFMYFAEFRKMNFPDIPFDAKPFKERLKRVIREKPNFGKMMALECRDIASNCNEACKRDFIALEPYWESLQQSEDGEMFPLLYQTIEITLTWHSKYDSHRELLKKVISMECTYLKNDTNQKSAWGPPIELLNIIQKQSDEDYLDVLQHIANELDETISFIATSDYLRQLNSFRPSGSLVKVKYNKLRKQFKSLYPEMFDI